MTDRAVLCRSCADGAGGARLRPPWLSRPVPAVAGRSWIRERLDEDAHRAAYRRGTGLTPEEALAADRP